MYADQVRKLARSAYWQNIYRSSKEIGTIQLFENTHNLSGIQSLFIFWLSVYSTLYSELGQKEWIYLTEEMIEDDILCDAFLSWRAEQREAEITKSKQDQKVSKLPLKDKSNVTPYSVKFE